MVNSSLKNKRLTIFAGHYGSGKTNLSVNYALHLKEIYDNVSIADLDIVNPYFRTKDSMSVLDANGVKLISSPFANSNVDTPALPADAYSLMEKNVTGIIDVGGDDRGALALGRFVDSIKNENDYEMLFVINKYRPLTNTPEKCVEIMKEIESASKLPFTGIINNSNLGDETTKEDILSSLPYADEVSRLTGLDIKFTSVKDTLSDSLKEEIKNIFPIRLYVKQSFSRK